jgi:hypothetical protein
MHTKTADPTAPGRLLPNVAALLLLVGLLLAGTNAQAACADPRGPKGMPPHRMPFLKQADDPAGQHSIVGLWHVTYTTGGELFYEAFDEWHADGTELESADASPINGNVCVGVWKETASGSVKLNHIGWTFDDSGNSTGTFTIAELNKVSARGNGYTGTFDFKVFDTNGTLVADITGNVSASRITPDD